MWHAGNAEEEAPYLRALEQGLKDLGYFDGRTIKLEHRFPNEIPERFEPLAADLAALKVDVLVAIAVVHIDHRPFNDVALAGHAVRSHFVRSMLAIAFDNSSRAAFSDAA